MRVAKGARRALQNSHLSVYMTPPVVRRKRKYRIERGAAER